MKVYLDSESELDTIILFSSNDHDQVKQLFNPLA